MPSTCSSISQGFQRSCENIASGVKNIWLANYNSSTSWTKGSDGIISAATSAPTFYRYEIREGTCSLNEEIVANAQFGSKNIRQSAEIVFIGQSQSGRTVSNTLLGARVVVGIETEEGKFVLFGESKALEVTAGRGTAGVQAGEENTIRLTISGLANAFAPTVSSTYAGTIWT